MFKFNFNQQAENSDDSPISFAKSESDEIDHQIKPGQEIQLADRHQIRTESYREYCSSAVLKVPFRTVNLKHIQQLIEEKSEGYENLSLASQLNSDVIKNVYEGTYIKKYFLVHCNYY